MAFNLFDFRNISNNTNSQPNIIQSFLNESKSNPALQSRRNAVIQMLQNQEDENFIKDTIVNKMGYKPQTPQSQLQSKLQTAGKVATAVAPILAPTMTLATTSTGQGAVKKTVENVQAGLSQIKNAGTGLMSGKYDIPEATMRAVQGGTNVLSAPISGTLGQVTEEIMKSIPQDFKDTIAKKVNPTINDVTNWYNKQSPEQKRNLQNIGVGVDVLSNFVGVKGVQKTVPALLKTSKAIGEGVEAGVSKTLQSPSKLLKKSGEALYKTSIKPNVNEAEMILKNKAGLGPSPITRADTALKLGITGTESQIGVKALKEADKIFKNTIGPALDKSTITHNIDDIFNKVEKEIMSGKGGELRKQELLKGLEALKDDYSTIGKKDFTTKDLQIEKSSLDEFTPQKVFKGVDVANGYNQVKNSLANTIRQQVRDDLGTVGVKNAKELYRDYANLIELSKIGIKGLTEGGLKGGFGTFWSTLYDKLATPIKTIGGKVLYRTGEGLEFTGPKGIKKVGDYLDINNLKIKDGNIEKLSNKTIKNDNNLTDITSIPNNTNPGVDMTSLKLKPKSVLSDREKLLITNKPKNAIPNTTTKISSKDGNVTKTDVNYEKRLAGLDEKERIDFLNQQERAKEGSKGFTKIGDTETMKRLMELKKKKEIEILTRESPKVRISDQYPKSLNDKFGVIKRGLDNLKTQKSAEKYTNIEVMKGKYKSFRDFYDEAKEFIDARNMDISVQELFDKMYDSDFVLKEKKLSRILPSNFKEKAQYTVEKKKTR